MNEKYKGIIFSQEEVKSARHADLYEYLIESHAFLFKKEGNSLRFLSDPSISIKKGFCGYNDFATGEHGNSVTFLMDKLKYTFPEAVAALLGKTHAIRKDTKEPGTLQTGMKAHSFCIPERSAGVPVKIQQYLSARGLPMTLINELLLRGLLYESSDHHNAVFLSRRKDYAEIRGTCPEIKFHGCRKLKKNCFWAYRENDALPEKAYVCESAIDALSLSVLLPQERVSSVFCSIGGVANQATIDRIKGFMPVVIAVDNDEAGERCRRNNPESPTIIPLEKDWNEDLLNLYV